MTTDEIINYEISKMESDEKALDTIYALEGENKGYQKNRSGENTVRKYIKGGLDLDRTTFISFLIFFGNATPLPDGYQINAGRLDTILRECGFPTLNPSDSFDDFVLKFMTSRNLKIFLWKKLQNMH